MRLRSVYFNPRTHVGCDYKPDATATAFSISIHAPTWGATLAGVSISSSSLFQSTHPRGVRLDSRHETREDAEFQSTHPRGVRHSVMFFSRKDLDISIHAPTWGATPTTIAMAAMIVFQSTHPRGVRPTINKSLLIGSVFQSTHPRGVRLTNVNLTSAQNVFQSTHPRGVRLCRLNSGLIALLFQSTHPRGVRLNLLVAYARKKWISIHAPTWGATVKPSNGWLLGHKDNEFANENIIIINSVNIT